MVTASRQAPVDADPVPKRQWHVAGLRLLARPLSDGAYLRIAHWLYYRRWPDYSRPSTLQEHIQAYLLRCRDPALVMVADKVAARRYIERTLGPGYTVPLLGAWRDAADVPLASLPYPLVLKPSHLSGRVLLLAAHREAAEPRIRARLRGWLRRDHSRGSREWFYAHIPRRVIAEPLLRDDSGAVPSDVKAYVIGGRVRYFQVDGGRFTRPTRNLYAPDWQLLPVRTSLPRHHPEPPPPALPRLIEIAEQLAAPFEFMRVDCYLIGERVLVGELTNSPGAGFGRYYPPQFGEELAVHWVMAGAQRRGDRSAPSPSPLG
ncbi:MAG TPA: ATP-grasp fold amidoligase family protein [Burkholderiaceae bacterium]|nr:ATP-grasp fold amidoligase family protein [Burkholderiaceae bacterium]